MVDWTKPIQTKSGKKAEVIGRYCFKDGETIVAAVNGGDNIWAYYEDGRLFQDEDNQNDIINVPEKRTMEVWANIYQDGTMGFYDTKKAADSINPEFHKRDSCVHLTGEYEIPDVPPKKPAIELEVFAVVRKDGTIPDIYVTQGRADYQARIYGEGYSVVRLTAPFEVQK